METSREQPPPSQRPVKVPTREELLEAALGYASRGLRVLPCKGKTPLTPSGVHDASDSPETIRKWWTRYPHANIGVATGWRMVCVDVDPRNGGDSALARLVREHEPLPATWVNRSGGSDQGSHYWFSVDTPLPGRKIGAGVDLRGVGNYVIMPPSLHPRSHRPYVVLEGGPDLVAPLPAWLRQVAGEMRLHNVATGEPMRIGDGLRNQTLTSYAGTMRRRDMSYEAILAALLQTNQSQCDPPLPEEEVVRIAQGIMRYGASVTSGEHLSDLGNARRLVVAYGSKMRWSADDKEWLLWADNHWRVDRHGAIHQLAVETVEGIYREAALESERDEEYGQKLFSWALKTESADKLRSMVTLAQTEPGIPVVSDELDARLLCFNVLNGCVVQEASS